jgi:hypothetical protein
LDEIIMAVSMTVEEINIMKRWGQAAKDRRHERAHDETGSGQDPDGGQRY